MKGRMIRSTELSTPATALNKPSAWTKRTARPTRMAEYPRARARKSLPAPAGQTGRPRSCLCGNSDEKTTSSGTPFSYPAAVLATCHANTKRHRLALNAVTLTIDTTEPTSQPDPSGHASPDNEDDDIRAAI